MWTFDMLIYFSVWAFGNKNLLLHISHYETNSNGLIASDSVPDNKRFFLFLLSLRHFFLFHSFNLCKLFLSWFLYCLRRTESDLHRDRASLSSPSPSSSSPSWLRFSNLQNRVHFQRWVEETSECTHSFVDNIDTVWQDRPNLIWYRTTVQKRLWRHRCAVAS